MIDKPHGELAYFYGFRRPASPDSPVGTLDAFTAINETAPVCIASISELILMK